MKKALGLALLLGFFISSFAQAPQTINYQGMARDLVGLPIAGKPISLKFDIHQSTPTGSVVFSEKHENLITTTNLGLFSARIGGITSLSTVNWSSGPYFLEVSIDEKGGTTYTSPRHPATCMGSL
jgi:hypothetical protein